MVYIHFVAWQVYIYLLPGSGWRILSPTKLSFNWLPALTTRSWSQKWTCYSDDRGTGIPENMGNLAPCFHGNLRLLCCISFAFVPQRWTQLSNQFLESDPGHKTGYCSTSYPARFSRNSHDHSIVSEKKRVAGTDLWKRSSPEPDRRSAFWPSQFPSHHLISDDWDLRLISMYWDRTLSVISWLICLEVQDDVPCGQYRDDSLVTILCLTSVVGWGGTSRAGGGKGEGKITILRISGMGQDSCFLVESTTKDKTIF